MIIIKAKDGEIFTGISYTSNEWQDERMRRQANLVKEDLIAKTGKEWEIVTDQEDGICEACQ